MAKPTRKVSGIQIHILSTTILIWPLPPTYTSNASPKLSNIYTNKPPTIPSSDHISSLPYYYGSAIHNSLALNLRFRCSSLLLSLRDNSPEVSSWFEPSNRFCCITS